MRSPARMPGIAPTGLTRRPVGPDGRQVVFTAVDVETTGLDDRDRIVELAAVVFRGDGEILDEYATVIDPVTVSPNGASHIHGLTDADMPGAPRAEAVLPELWRLSAGTVLAAHNLAFEQRFLENESRRTGLPVPPVLALCTMRTARAQLDGRSFSLKSLYKTATGTWADDDHTALSDARSTAALLTWILGHSPGGLYLQDWPPPPADHRYASVRPGRTAPRPVPMRSNRLGDFVKRFPRSRTIRPTADGAHDRYLRLLADVVDDERITLEEAAELEACARAGGLTQVQLEELHHQAFFLVLGDEVNVSPADLSPVRRRELLSLAQALGARPVVDALAPLVDADLLAAAKPAGTGYLKGWRIGLELADDPAFSRLRSLADQHDAIIAKRLTKTVRFLAAAAAESPEQAKAREVGIQVVTVQEAARILDEAVRAADLAAFERRQAEARWEAQRAESDRYWRHTWKRTEDLSAPDREPSY